MASLPYVRATLVFLEIRVPFWEVDGLPGSRLPGERVVLPVELPAFGQHVFFVQQWLDDDPSKVYRLRPDAFVHRPECDVFWRRPAGRFAGETKLET